MREADRGRMPLMAIIAMAGVVAGQRPGDGPCTDSPAAAEPFATALSDSGTIYRGTFAPAGDELWFSSTRPCRPTAGSSSSPPTFAAVTPDGCDLVFVRDFSGFYRVALRAAIGADQTP